MRTKARPGKNVVEVSVRVLAQSSGGGRTTFRVTAQSAGPAKERRDLAVTSDYTSESGTVAAFDRSESAALVERWKMGSAFGLVVPADDQTKATIEQYYEHRLDRLDPFVDADSVEDRREYRRAVERLASRGDVMIYEKLLSDFPAVMDPLPSEIYREYADNDVIYDKIGLAKLNRSFTTARERLAESGRLEDYHERRLEKYRALVDFAIENGYGVSYP